jgi:hypothetical protein
MHGRVNTLLFWANGLLMLALILAVARHDRLAADDLRYLSLSEQHGPWGAMVQLYQHWNPRWSATLVVNLLLTELGPQDLWLYVAATLIGLVCAFALLISAINHRFDLRLDGSMTVSLSIYLTGALFLITPIKWDVWYWITTGPMYLLNVVALLLASGLVLHSKVKAMFGAIPLLFLGVYAGGANEAVALSAIIASASMLIAPDALKEDERTKLHLVTIGVCIGFAILALGPGIWVRHGAASDLGTVDRLVVAAKTYLRTVFIDVPLSLPMALLVLLPLAGFGMRSFSMQCSGWKHLVMAHSRALLIIDMLLVANAALLAFALGDHGPGRAWFIIPLSVTLLMAVAAFRSGAWLLSFARSRTGLLITIAQLGLSIFLVLQFSIELPKAQTYSQAYDDREALIRSLPVCGTDTLVVLEPLPDAGWLPDADITSDTAYFASRFLSQRVGGRVRFIAK